MHFIHQGETFSLGMSQPLHKEIFCSLKESKLAYHRNPYVSIGFSSQNRVSDSRAFQHQKANFHRHCFSFSPS